MSSGQKWLMCARSHFSLGESLLSPKKIVELTVSNSVKAVALVDTMTISGMTEFSQECKKNGVHPIIGCTLRVVMDINYRKPAKSALELPKNNPEWLPKVFVKNEQGMVELMQLLSLANSPERFYGNARLSLDDVIATMKLGNLILSTGDLQGLFSLKEKSYNPSVIMDRLSSEIKASDLRFELFSSKSILFDTLNKNALSAATDAAGTLLVTNLLLYENAVDAATLDVLSVITSNGRMTDAWRNIQSLDQFHNKTVEQVDVEVGRFGVFDCDIPDICTYIWKPMPVSLPKMATDERAEMLRQVVAGWERRIKNPIMGYMPHEELLPVYKKRLAYELSILAKMKFERYFLLVQDVVMWSKNNGILVGPGRGSCSGSLVSFLMGITDVDPIRFNLLFERFINPDRIDLPDADLDFMSTRRGDVIDYLIDKYGADRVAGVTNYGTLASASALRDCGRVHGLSREQLAATRYVPKENGKSFTLAESASVIPEIQKFKDEYPKIWEHATKLEGVMRSLGKHAAGVVIADEPIANRAVVETRSGMSVANWDRNSIESWGLIKMDLLGLSTLDTLRIAIDYIYENTGKKIDLLSIPIDDYDTMKELSLGRTVGIFQLESCISGDAIVDGMTLRDRFKNQTINDEIRCINEDDGSIEAGKIGKIIHSGTKRVFRVTLSDGRSVKMTADHKVYTGGKWVKLSDVGVGDKIAVVKG